MPEPKLEHTKTEFLLRVLTHGPRPTVTALHVTTTRTLEPLLSTMHEADPVLGRIEGGVGYRLTVHPAAAASAVGATAAMPDKSSAVPNTAPTPRVKSLVIEKPPSLLNLMSSALTGGRIRGDLDITRVLTRRRNWYDTESVCMGVVGAPAPTGIVRVLMEPPSVVRGGRDERNRPSTAGLVVESKSTEGDILVDLRLVDHSYSITGSSKLTGLGSSPGRPDGCAA